MTAAAGGFYSATDADSLTPSGHEEEGYFFTWTPSELQAVLRAEQRSADRVVYWLRVVEFDGAPIRESRRLELQTELLSLLGRVLFDNRRPWR